MGIVVGLLGGREEEEGWKGFAEVGEHGGCDGGCVEVRTVVQDDLFLIYILRFKLSVVRDEWKAVCYAGRSLGWVWIRMLYAVEYVGM